MPENARGVMDSPLWCGTVPISLMGANVADDFAKEMPSWDTIGSI